MLPSSHQDTVGDNQTYINRELYAYVVSKRFQDFTYDSYQSSYHNQLDDDADALGIVLRNSEITTLANAVITVTESPITMAGSSFAVTASAEQIPSTCTVPDYQFPAEQRILLYFSLKTVVPYSIFLLLII